MFRRSLKRINASVAPSRATPGPASTTGCFALASTWAARRTWSSSGEGSTGVFTGSTRASVARSATSSGSTMKVAPGRLGRGLLEGLAHHLRRGDAHRHHVAPLRDRAEQRHEVDELVRFLVDAIEARLRDERDERVRVELGVRDPEHQVDRAGTEGGQADAGLAGERTVRVGHERSAALVSRGDEPDRAVGERVDRVEVLLAGEAEDELDALVLEALDDHARDGASRSAHVASVSDRSSREADG